MWSARALGEEDSPDEGAGVSRLCVSAKPVRQDGRTRGTRGRLETGTGLADCGSPVPGISLSLSGRHGRTESSRRTVHASRWLRGKEEFR